MAMTLSCCIPSLVVGGLCLSMLKCAVTSEEFPSSWFTQWKRAKWVFLLAAVAISIMLRFNTIDMLLAFSVSLFISLFYPYLSRTSRRRQFYAGEKFRDNNDRLIKTSAIYLIAAVVACYYGQFNLALMCSVTYVGSSLYHKHREMVFFNFDNIFATSLLVVFVYVLCSSYYHHDIIFRLGILGAPVAVFLIVYCGMPADIVLNSSGLKNQVCCVRTGRDLYDSVHTMWHLVSGAGPIMAAWYFNFLVEHNLVSVVNLYNPLESAMVEVSSITLLPFASIVISLFVNVVGNYFGVMPLE